MTTLARPVTTFLGRSPRWLFLVSVLAAVASAGVFLYARGLEKRRELDLRSLDEFPRESPTRLWITGESDLVWLNQEGSRFWVRSAPAFTTPITLHDMPEIVSERFDLRGPGAEIYVGAETRPPVATAIGARQGLFAYAEHAELVIAWLGRRPEAVDLMDLKKHVVDLAFVGSSLAILYADGELKLRELPTSISFGAKSFASNGRLHTSGRYIATFSPDRRQSTLFAQYREGPLDKHNFEWGTDAGKATAVAVSQGGRLAVGTADGKVLLSERGSESLRLTAIRAPAPVSALAFFDEERLLVGGAFDGLYVSSDGEQHFIDLPEAAGMRLLAVSEDFVAFTTGGKVVTASVVWRLEPSSQQTWLNWLATLLAALAVALPMLALTASSAPRLRNLLFGAGTEEMGETKAEKQSARSSPGPAAPSWPAPSPPLPLIEACLNGKCVLYAGAGLGAALGLPTWQSLVRELLQFARERRWFADDAFARSLEEALDAGQADAVADSVVSACPRRELLHEFLRQRFVSRRLPPSEVHRLLRRIPFSAALTTNFDDVLERSYGDAAIPVTTPHDAERLLELLSRREFFLLKLYGSLDRPDTVLLAPAEYVEAVARNLSFSQFVEGLFVSRTLLFVGASLEGIEAYLGGLPLRGDVRGNHYALVAVEGTAWLAKADFLKRRFGIQVLPYSISPEHPEVLRFVREIVQATAPARQASFTKEVPTNGIRALTLRNIGPFRDLRLELNASWNVLLGDNGVGKTSILRALAVGIVGRDAETYAGRLIRAGETSGTIVLETARDTYKTELRRRDSGAEVSVAPVRPLEVEGWLALGFPPLRTVTWERPAGVTAEGRRRPTVEDLMPIIKGDPDPRLDRMKQWIVNLDARINYERSQRRVDTRYERLLAEFFRLFDRVTPGFKVEFGSVNPDTREVSVKTVDGALPIELISQGATSLMGWIGVLLQRLYEVYGDEDDPSQNYALVLIDEIDAHMHPEWQQAVVHRLREIFPRVQFVATTHSPLVVGGMPAEQVIRFRRTSKGVVERVSVSDDMTMGRADQILTGPLFDLASTRDPKTHEALMEYTRLAAQDDLSSEDQEKLQELAATLEVRLPAPAERAEARQAFELIEGALDERLAGMSTEQKQKLQSEIKVQLQENVTGSRRPG